MYRSVVMIEDNAGGLYVWDGEMGYAKLERSSASGIDDLVAFSDYDTNNWNVEQIDDEPEGKVIAKLGRDGAVRVYLKVMGDSGRIKFGFSL